MNSTIEIHAEAQSRAFWLLRSPTLWEAVRDYTDEMERSGQSLNASAIFGLDRP